MSVLSALLDGFLRRDTPRERGVTAVTLECSGGDHWIDFGEDRCKCGAVILALGLGGARVRIRKPSGVDPANVSEIPAPEPRPRRIFLQPMPER